MFPFPYESAASHVIEGLCVNSLPRNNTEETNEMILLLAVQMSNINPSARRTICCNVQRNTRKRLNETQHVPHSQATHRPGWNDCPAVKYITVFYTQTECRTCELTSRHVFFFTSTRTTTRTQRPVLRLVLMMVSRASSSFTQGSSYILLSC